MTETLRDLLRRDADNISIPLLDLDGLVAEAVQRQLRRRVAVVVTAAAATAAIVAGSVLSSVTGQICRTPRWVPPSLCRPSRHSAQIP